MDPGIPPRAPSGLFPSGRLRPTFREPHPVRIGAVVAGAGVAAAWLLLFGLLAKSTRSYAWLTLVASAAAWLCALALARYGDRGVAVGVAISTGFGLAITVAVVVERWVSTGWLLW